MKIINKNTKLDTLLISLILVTLIFTTINILLNFLYIYPYYQNLFYVNDVTNFAVKCLFKYLFPITITLGYIIIIQGIFYSFMYLITEAIKSHKPA